ncbi:MAG: nitroreductase family protein [Burkholderiaceae bacterium]|jgi:nitroreductase|nr:nitroreductase family protein [Burkholderiaceae bacterium]
MEQEHIPYLLALHRARDWATAAQACHVSQAKLKKAVADAEREYGHALVQAEGPFQGFTAEGERVVAWAQSFSDAMAALKQVFTASKKRSAVAPLLERRSVSPKRLEAPGPDVQEIDVMIEAALSAPDHGGLHPWRVLVFPAGSRERLADLFEQEKLRRDPLAPCEDVRRAREHATRSPALLAFIVSPKPRMRVPEREQWLAAGAALGNLLNAAHQLGFGAIMLSGERCFDPALCAGLGIEPTEHLAGFVSLGSIAAAPPPRKPILLDAVRALWDSGDSRTDAPAPSQYSARSMTHNGNH